MEFNTQIEWAEFLLKKNGKISRNEALRNYVSRLASIIFDLRKRGFCIVGEFVETTSPFGNGRDYRYTLLGQPK